MPPEPQDQDTTNAGGGERGTGTQAGKTEEQIRAEVEAEFEQRVTGLLEKNEGYKGLQRAFQKRQDEWAAQAARDRAELAALKGQLEQANSGFGFLSDTLFENLPPESRDKAEAELRKRKQSQLETEIDNLKRAMMQPPPGQSAPGMSQQEFERALAEAEAEAIGALKDAVKELGVDPSNKELDYGKPGEESFAVRLRKVVKTAKAVRDKQDEAEVESVRQKGTPPPTRTTGGAAIQHEDDGESLLRLGSKELMDKMRMATPKVARKR